MTASFTENLKQRYVGNLSEGEQQVCVTIRDLLRAALADKVSFSDTVERLWGDLSVLREFDYDVEKAIESGRFDPVDPQRVAPARDKSLRPVPISDSERAFLEDADGLTDWVTRNGVSFSVVLGILGHDISELARDAFQLEKTLGPGRCVFPKVTGWAQRNAEPVGEADEQA